MNTRSFSKPRRATALAGGLGLVLAIALPSALASQGFGKTQHTPEDLTAAGKVFQSSCTFCHVVPDPAHPTDRAWLNQVSDTA